MKIAVFGGAGLAGSAFVEHALRQGHGVRALVRESTSVPPGLATAEVVRGDALDASAVAETISGCDVVVSSLGGFRGPESLDAGTANIIDAMRRQGLRRLVVLQGFHVSFEGDPENFAKRIVKLYLRLRCRPLLPHSAALGRLLRETDDIEWTLVRVPPIVDAPFTGRAELGRFALGPLSKVTVGDTAATLLDFATSTASVHDAPMLVTGRR
ncbi:MAG: NAD(P)H-binding protein [Microcella sp.]|uniref:NAD(P)-dependent oxidoreductase n=1 Tax=Microcella sp. TaxID=1913979 RepID=UPI0024C609E1|nr:NAD(P)H-binding protein [Microcella sp.]UYN83070.1 MAG: NAD(P)H-binding protein [Microcella sp.]